MKEIRTKKIKKTILSIVISACVLSVLFYCVYLFPARNIDYLYIVIPASIVSSVFFWVFDYLFRRYKSNSKILYVISRVVFLIVVFMALVMIMTGWGDLPHYISDPLKDVLLYWIK